MYEIVKIIDESAEEHIGFVKSFDSAHSVRHALGKDYDFRKIDVETGYDIIERVKRASS